MYRQFLVSLFTLTFACSTEPGSTDDTQQDLETTLTSKGIYNVSYRTGSITYVDPIGEERTIPYALWYPTSSSDGGEMSYTDLFDAPGVLGGEQPIASGNFPIYIHSHGSLAYMQASGKIATHLASHGWIVAAPEHVSNTVYDGLFGRDTEIYLRRPADVSATLDHLLSNDPFASQIDADRIVGGGQSFGGYTMHSLAGAMHDMPFITDGCDNGTLQAEICTTMTPDLATLLGQDLSDDRILSVISMATRDWDLHQKGLADAKVPVFVMRGTLDEPETGDLLWGDFDHPDDRRLDIIDGGHNSFTDVGPQENGALETVVTDPIIHAYTLAWAKWTIGESEVQPVIDGDILIGEPIEFAKK